MQFFPVSSKDHSPCEKWNHCDFLGWVHLVLRLKEGSSAALWKGSEIRPCNKQFISNSPVPYTKLYFTIRVATTSVLMKPPNKIWSLHSLCYYLYIKFSVVFRTAC
jgi:hypothetical protein